MYINSFGLRTEGITYFKITRTLEDGTIQALGRGGQGGKRGWSDGQYYWLPINNERVIKFTYEDAQPHLKDFNTYRRYCDGSIRKPFKGIFQLVPI